MDVFPLLLLPLLLPLDGNDGDEGVVDDGGDGVGDEGDGDGDDDDGGRTESGGMK